MSIASAGTLRTVLHGTSPPCVQREELEELLRGYSASDLLVFLYDWIAWARGDQLPPSGDWTTWLVLGGRGAGKTRAGAEWVRALVHGQPPFAAEPVKRIALVGETLADVRAVMVEGQSGILSAYPVGKAPRFEPSLRQLVWGNGAVAQIFSAEEPDSLRGPQFEAAWCDELAKWRYAERAWGTLQFALRLGTRPRQMVTTTPRPFALLKRLIDEPGTVATKILTASNAPNLAPAFLDAVVARYRGTRLGRQELDAEILEDRPDALWPRALIERWRVGEAPTLARVVVAVDPPVTSGERADACGIVVAGQGEDGRGYVIEDATVDRASPLQWAKAAISAYQRHAADCVVAEVNQGGELVASVLRQVDPSLPIRCVRATRGKWLRAEPVAALYEQGRISHLGAFPALEDQMCDFGRDGLSGGASPDRLDALVWALTELMLGRGADPRIRAL
jgi:phage terminase large subunit-like protein